MKKITILMVLAFMIYGFNGWGQNIVSNGDFESWTGGTPDSWTTIDGGITVTEETTIIHGGNSSASVDVTTGSQSNTDFRQNVNVINGHNYSVSVWIYHTEGHMKARLYVDGYLNYSDNTITGSWQEMTSSYTASSTGSISIGLRFYDQSGFDGDEIVYVDDYVITDLSGGNTPPSITNITQTPTTVTSSSTVSVSADVTDSDGTVAGVELHWGTTSGSLGTTISMSNTSGDTYTTDTDIPAQANGTTVYYEVYAVDDDGDNTTSPEQSYTVTDPATTTLPYTESFDTDLGDCYTYSVSGDIKYWTYGSYGSNGYADMNGYNSGDTEEDWLILPGIDFDSYSNEIMTFDTWWKYGNDDANNYMKLYYSANYPGIGDPSGSTWTEISFTQGASDAWTSSGTLDLSGITGTSVYIAFKYHYEAGSYRHWEVDNISITPSVQVNVTFQVNMANETVSADGVHVAGSFNGWSTTNTELFDPDGDNIYTATVTANSNTEIEFKYLNGNAWGTEETVPSGCQKPGTTNRYEYVTAPYDSIPVVCFGSCTDCGGNYYDITFQVNMQNETVSGDGVYLAGTFTSWGSGALQMTQNGNVWSTTVSLQENSPEEYKFVNGDPNNGGTWESINNRQLTVPSSDSTLELVCFNSYSPCPVADYMIINEVDADQAGTDSQEFIELYDGGTGNISLDGLVVVLYNGNGDVSYGSFDLDGYFTNANGYFVLGSSNVPNVDMVIGNTNILQNGADAVALYTGNDTDFPNGTAVTTTNLLDALVYDTNDGDDVGLLVLLNPGQPQVNEGGRGSSSTHSNQRLPNGSGGQRNTYTYDQAPPTPGAMNVAAFTDWSGAASSDWFDAGNWNHGVPTASLNAVIPDISGTGNTNPAINGSGAVTGDLVVQSGGELTIGTAGQLTVNGSLSNQNGAAGIVLQSTSTGQGSLITNDATYMTVQTYLSSEQWHGVSAPVDNDTAGVFMNVYLLEYSESDSSWNYIVPVDTPLPLGKGFFAYAANNLTGNYTANHVGVINVNDVSVNLNYTDPNPYPGEQGWNMIGNPFTSAVEWNGNWTLTNMDATMYIYDGTQYLTMNTSGNGTAPSAYIPVGTGFMVRANASGASVTIPASQRSHSSQGFYKNSNNDLTFTVEGNGYNDKMVVQFNDNATPGFDSQFDAYKLRGIAEAPQMYMVQNGVELTTNILPFEENLLIPVNLEVGNDGIYTFKADFDETMDVYLEDLQTGEIIQLTNDNPYSFFASSDDAPDRFILHFGIMTNIDDNSISDAEIYSNSNNVYVKTKINTEGTIEVYNMMGQNIVSKQITSTMNKITIIKSGYYIVKVLGEDFVETQKVYIK